MAWSSTQYLKFEDERTRPARDLLAAVPLQSAERAYDLGCGPGNSTELIVARFGAAAVTGVDSDPNMLAAARSRLKGTPFIEADLEQWQPPEPADLLYANAVFQWLPDHLDVLVRLMDGLKPGGVLAVQMPDNLQEPSHTAMEAVAEADGPWRQRFRKQSAKRIALAAPHVYFERLSPKAKRVDVWQTTYHHPMANAAAIVEWVKGTGLRPYLDVAGPHAEEFTAAYLERITEAYPPMTDGRVLFRFPRLFVVAVKA